MAGEKILDVVCLTLPQNDHMAKIVRLTTAAVANKTGLNLDQADDLQTGLDELFRLFLADSHPPRGNLCIKYRLHPGMLEVVAGGLSLDLFGDDNELNRYSRFILEQIADKVEELPSPLGGYEVILIKNMAELS